MNYLHPHLIRTHYCQRTAEGRSIGSAMIEGAYKAVLNRLKQTGARWRVRHAKQILAICGLIYGDFWNQYWLTQGGLTPESGGTQVCHSTYF